MMAWRGGSLLALAAMLSACAGPRAEAPVAAATVPPPAWRTALGPGEPIRADWWAAFGDPQLTAIVERALANNTDIAIAAGRVEEARSQLDLARAQLAPQVSAAVPVSGGRSLSPFGTASSAIGSQPAVQASYDLDLFGRLKAASGAARAQLLASEGARDTVRLGVAASAASGYITLRALDARLQVVNATLTARTEGLRIARRRAETGYTSALELHQAEAEYNSTQQLVPQVQLAIARAENALSLLQGDVPGAPPRGLPLDRLLTPPVPAGLPADLLRRRPDLYQAEQTLVAADRGLDSARAAFLPDITLTGSAGVVLSTALANPVGIFALGGSILAPLFSGGRLEAQQGVATARRDQAAFAYRRAALTAFREVDDSLAGVARGGEQYRDIAGQRDALAAALNNARNRYRAGYTSYIEQLDAQRGLLSAELALIQARADRLNAYVLLYQAMGGGWSAYDIGVARKGPGPGT